MLPRTFPSCLGRQNKRNMYAPGPLPAVQEGPFMLRPSSTSCGAPLGCEVVVHKHCKESRNHTFLKTRPPPSALFRRCGPKWSRSRLSRNEGKARTACTAVCLNEFQSPPLLISVTLTPDGFQQLCGLCSLWGCAGSSAPAASKHQDTKNSPNPLLKPVPRWPIEKNNIGLLLNS